MSFRKLLVAWFLILFPTAGLAGPILAVTPSGSTETVFAGSARETVSTLAGRCLDNKWKVVSTTGNEVVCEAPLSTGQSLMSQMLLGNSYSTAPRRFFRFNVVETQGVSRVQAAGWVETQMAFGQVQRAEFSDADFHNGMMGFMTSAGGQFPVGTTFPNHVIMGFDSEHVQQGKYSALRVKKVRPETAAMRAGMQNGDIVTTIAGRRFKTDEEYLEALARAAKSSTYAVEVDRAGAKLKLTLDREFRPPFSESVVAPGATATHNAASTAPVSVADEIQKLLQLQQQGILTPEEFEIQKNKVLAR